MTNKPVKKRRRKLNGRFWAVIGVVALALIALIIWLLVSGEEAIIDDTRETGNISLTADYEAIIIRDETAVTADSFNRAEYLVPEGQYVEPDTHIMNVYKRGFSDELLHSLYQTELEIYAAQLEQLGETRDPTLKGYNESVEIIEANIAEAVMKEKTEDLLKLRLELKNVLAERSSYLKSVLQQTETLKNLYRKEEEQNSLIATWRSELFTEKAGAVSFYFDDYENALNEEKLSLLTSDLVSAASKGRTAASWTTQNENLAYRLVSPDHWYIVFLTDASKPLRTVAGETYNVKIEGYGEYEATASEPMLSGKKAINILKVSENIGDLINVRRVHISVLYDAGGFKIRLDGIINEEGRQYIDIMLSKEKLRVEIDVFAVDKKYAVIDVKDGEETEILTGVRYWIPKGK